jgi:hypothetical protein
MDAWLMIYCISFNSLGRVWGYFLHKDKYAVLSALHQIPTKPDIFQTETQAYNIPIFIYLSIVNSLPYNLAEIYV